MKILSGSLNKSMAAGKAVVFDGRVVRVISTDGLLPGNNLTKSNAVNVLSVKQQWTEILAYALDPQLACIISSEKLEVTDAFRNRVDLMPPASFPGKLLVMLLQRFLHFKGAADKGLTIICLGNDPKMLESIILELAHLNSLDPWFMDWVENANHFSNR